MAKETPRVVVTNPFCGLVFMQVCAVADATNEEILEVCNKENPSGTTNGWGGVVRTAEEFNWLTKVHLPKPCANDASRVHFLVYC